MATTTNYGWETPDDTDLVKDGAAAIRTLGNSIDTTMATMVPKTIVDAKGDIIAATAADTVSRVAIGTNGQVLTADSTAATGLKWAAPAASGAGGSYPSRIAGNTWYARSGNSGATTSIVTGSLASIDRTYYVPILVSSITATRIALATYSTFSGTGITMRLGIYNNDSVNNVPSTVLLDAGTVSPSVADTGYEITISQALPAGLYWLAAKLNARTSGTNAYYASPSTSAGWSPNGAYWNSIVNACGGNSYNGYFEDQATGTLKTVSSLNPSNQTIINLALGF